MGLLLGDDQWFLLMPAQTVGVRGGGEERGGAFLLAFCLDSCKAGRSRHDGSQAGQGELEVNHLCCALNLFSLICVVDSPSPPPFFFLTVKFCIGSLL